MPISLATLKQELATCVRLDASAPDAPRVVFKDPPTYCDTPLKIVCCALRMHVVGFSDLHTHDQVQLATEALRAGYVWTDQPEELPT